MAGGEIAKFNFLINLIKNISNNALEYTPVRSAARREVSLNQFGVVAKPGERLANEAAWPIRRTRRVREDGGEATNDDCASVSGYP